MRGLLDGTRKSEGCDGVMQERVPEETLLVFHTLHVPRHTSDPGMWQACWIGFADCRGVTK